MGCAASVGTPTFELHIFNHVAVAGTAQSEEPAPPGPVDIDSAQVQANPRDVGALAFPLMDLELRKALGLDGASIDRSPKAMRARIQDRIATLRQLREERQASQREEQ